MSIILQSDISEVIWLSIILLSVILLTVIALSVILPSQHHDSRTTLSITENKFCLKSKYNQPGSTISNGRVPKGCLGRVFNYKLGRVHTIEFCCVPATSAAHNRLLFFLFAAAIYSTNEAMKAGGMCH